MGSGREWDKELHPFMRIHDLSSSDKVSVHDHISREFGYSCYTKIEELLTAIIFHGFSKQSLASLANSYLRETLLLAATLDIEIMAHRSQELIISSRARCHALSDTLQIYFNSEPDPE
ncbi:hypothetical protein ABEW05_005274 [Botrytis cinerea]